MTERMVQNMNKKWWKEAVVYQVYPRSFMDADGDGMGDLRGITKRLDYLKELGVDAVWLSPFYKSPNDDNGYDISDYRDIMDEFGTMEDFDELSAEMHKRGIRLIVDLVVNHSSDEHPWFLESRKSKDNPYRDYYIWREGRDGKEPNNWQSRFSGSAWEKTEETGEYYLHLFSKKQPDLNWENPKVRQEVYDIMRFWMDKGVDGFRLDVANFYSKVEGLPDGRPAAAAIGAEHYENGPKIHEYFHEMNHEVMAHYPDMMTVGETSGVTIEEAKKYANTDGSEMSMVFQFEHVTLEYVGRDKFTLQPVKLTQFKKVMSKWQTELDGKAWNSLYLANHDQPRSVSRWGDDGKYRKESAKMLYTMLLTMQGTPYIYQGEEIGMTNVSFDSVDDYQDIQIRNAWQERIVEGGGDGKKLLEAIHYIGRDNARTPMQWDDTENAGFTTGTPWLKVNENYKTINAKEAMEDPDSIFHYIQKLIRQRHESEVAVYGDFTEFEAENENLYLYNRSLNGENLLVALNFTGEEQKFTVPAEIQASESKLYISNYPEDDQLGDKVLKPYEAVVYSWK
jgi:oligo-1,6-glucosidase